MSYLQQLKTHKASLEITLQQCDNDMEHARKSIDLLQEQKLTIVKQLDLIASSINEEQEKELQS